MYNVVCYVNYEVYSHDDQDFPQLQQLPAAVSSGSTSEVAAVVAAAVGPDDGIIG